MQLIITDARFSRNLVLELGGLKLFLLVMGMSLTLMLLAAGMYHWVFLKGAREGWPVISSVVRLMVKDEFAQRDRFMRENIDLMARQLGEMQAKMTQLESLGERVSGLAGINPAEIRSTPGQGGAMVGAHDMSMEQLQTALDGLERQTSQRTDIMTVIESRLFEQKVKKMMVPTQAPVQTARLGSTFGWRIDPFTGRIALHTGLDFPAEVGTPIYAAAGGVVVTQEFHPQYGNMIEIDHGNDLVTRYGHSSKVFVKKGDLVKRGQKIAEVGTTGRSTGPHLHFEVLVSGVPQDPQKFLTAGGALVPNESAGVQVPALDAAPSPNPAAAMANKTVALAVSPASAPSGVRAPAPPAPASVAAPARPGAQTMATAMVVAPAPHPVASLAPAAVVHASPAPAAPVPAVATPKAPNAPVVAAAKALPAVGGASSAPANASAVTGQR